MKLLIRYIVLCTVLLSLNSHAEVFDLTAFADSVRGLDNPDKGWYHHYYDNGIDKYLLGSESHLDEFPGMDHLYLRLAWSFLEPEEGQFNWTVIDTVIEKWVAKGYDISFRISCRETGLRFATPKWVYDLGAKGVFTTNWGNETWEPDYGDPIFLEKLEQFHKVFAARYDGQPWLSYVDIGSYGDWGEGHTSFGSNVAWPNAVMKKHIDIHVENYKHTLIVISDDFLAHRGDAAAQDLRQYIEERGIAWRDDSILVDWYVQQNADTYSVARPEVFTETWMEKPVVLELQHYQHVLDAGNWVGPNGSTRGADILWGAINLTHPTFIGYHGYADQWLNDNPQITREIANKVGYWYFLHAFEIPALIIPGKASEITLTFENKGLAPAYHNYRVKVKLQGNNQTWEQVLTDIDTRTWMPGQPVVETTTLHPPSSLMPGDYSIFVKLVKATGDPERAVHLALSEAIMDQNGYYRIGSVIVKESGVNETPTIQLNTTPTEGNVPLNVQFDASESNDLNGDSLAFYWDFGNGSTAEGNAVMHQFATPNVFRVVANAYDGQGGMGQKIQPIHTHHVMPDINKKPVLDLTVDQTTGDTPLTVNFDASGSHDPDGDPLTFLWDFGNGETASGAQVQYTYAYTGEYTVTLVIDDGHEIYNDAITSLTVKAGNAELLEGAVLGTPGSRGDAGHTIDNVFDGDASTYFEAPERSGAWVGLDLGEGVSAYVVSLGYQPRDKRGSRMIGGVFQGANAADFSDAVDLFTIEDAPDSEPMTYALVNDIQPFRYFRYVGPDNAYCTVAELQFLGTFVTDVDTDDHPPVFDFVLYENYPNPFNATTLIRYDLDQPSQVKVAVFDILGKQQRLLLDAYQNAGRHQLQFDGNAMPSGAYLYTVQAGSHTNQGRMLLIK